MEHLEAAVGIGRMEALVGLLGQVVGNPIPTAREFQRVIECIRFLFVSLGRVAREGKQTVRAFNRRITRTSRSS